MLFFDTTVFNIKFPTKNFRKQKFYFFGLRMFLRITFHTSVRRHSMKKGGGKNENKIHTKMRCLLIENKPRTKNETNNRK